MVAVCLCFTLAKPDKQVAELIYLKEGLHCDLTCIAGLHLQVSQDAAISSLRSALWRKIPRKLNLDNLEATA